LDERKSLTILKSAILLEKKGKAFYEKMADQATNDATKGFFKMMAGEEENHIDILSAQYKQYQSSQQFSKISYPEHTVDAVASGVLTQEITAKIAAAGFEAAAISAAMSMEERAIQLYSKRAGETWNAEEKSLYEWLASWERTHLELLSKIDRELTESIWHDNQFWPF